MDTWMVHKAWATVASIIKTRFPNLTTEETIALTGQILEALDSLRPPEKKP